MMHAPDAAPPPQDVMMQMVNGKLVSRCVSIVADLAIADRLAGGPRDAASLAAETGTDADALFRVLRMLAGLGVFRRGDDGRFENSPLSDTLRSDVPGSVRPYARWLGTDLHWRVTSDMDHSVRTGAPALTADDPDAQPFEVLARHPEAQAVFNDAMTGLSAAAADAIVGAFDFTPYRRIVDVGGGHGFLALAIARAAPEAEVTVLDLPHVVEGTRRRIEEANTHDRVRAVEGSFFEAVPGPADLCIMKHIIHDWDDAEATTILSGCRHALDDGGRIMVCEMVVTDGPEGTPARVLDIEMLIGPGGRERTEDEFRALFAGADLELAAVHDTPMPIKLLEAVKA